MLIVVLDCYIYWTDMLYVLDWSSTTHHPVNATQQPVTIHPGVVYVLYVPVTQHLASPIGATNLAGTKNTPLSPVHMTHQFCISNTPCILGGPAYWC